MGATSWGYGRLCALVYQVDKPIGTSFFALRRYDVDGFTALLQDTGFTVTAVHADYTRGKPPAADSQVWTFEATPSDGSPGHDSGN
ncbi:hypothetical protein I6A84_36230 [Frankia sp. CNm7]|uniref:Methyltransferase n=1 Tax=Frankia nepalensis TaxID=1836974 RepID=A0A937RJN1_9ACTN|nr:hypothetical protein [Frankia nepalensis]MBL7500493.1 hypothetical protein [Frankia nepalensis]MBL7511228.1 hypothetical protein [Frankia nepalensis]MBL7523362.1 hypothetical protein [Frankia nepalensis]MBL7631482.1 hypothetical protein [Frankia nepalensis]